MRWEYPQSLIFIDGDLHEPDDGDLVICGSELSDYFDVSGLVEGEFSAQSIDCVAGLDRRRKAPDRPLVVDVDRGRCLMSDRTDDQLKELAKDYVAGKVFTDKDIASSDYRSLMPMVFLPIGLLNREQIESYAKDPPALLYEYTSKRLLRTINGYPQFMSCYSMNQGEVDRFIVFVQKVKEALDSV